MRIPILCNNYLLISFFLSINSIDKKKSSTSTITKHFEILCNLTNTTIYSFFVAITEKLGHIFLFI